MNTPMITEHEETRGTELLEPPYKRPDQVTIDRFDPLDLRLEIRPVDDFVRQLNMHIREIVIGQLFKRHSRLHPEIGLIQPCRIDRCLPHVETEPTIDIVRV